MKKLTQLLSAITLFLVLAAVPAMAIQNKTAEHKAHAKMADKGNAKMVYMCEHCNEAMAKKGTCAMCKTAMKATKATMVYACPMCKAENMKGGKCMKCKVDMKKMANTYSCDHCKTTSAHAGNCKMCKMAMKKKSTPMKGKA